MFMDFEVIFDCFFQIISAFLDQNSQYKQIQDFILFNPAQNEQLLFQRIMSKSRVIYSIAQLKKEYQKDHTPGKQAPERNFSTIGVIVDCSNLYRYEDNRDYTQKLKIIDSSNQTQPLQIYLYSNRKQDFSLNIKVGDILFINNFKVSLYKDQLQAKSAYKVENSFFRIFSGNPQSSAYAPVDKKVGLDDEQGQILGHINSLRLFSKDYFKKNRVSVVFKQQGKQKKGQPKKITSSDFDLILRVVESQQLINHYRIKLTNDKDDFQLNYARHIEPGVYKIRSVAQVKWEDKLGTLIGNDYTYFLEIANWMKSYDSKQWDRLVPGPQANKRKVKRAKIESKILNKGKIRSTNLRQLFLGQQHQEQVRVKVEIMDVRTSFENAIKKFDTENHTEKSYLSQTGQYIYSIHLLISDQSIVGQVYNAYIYTYDNRGIEFLPELHPSTIYGRNILDVKENYDNFVNRLCQQTDIKEVPIELILSPLWNGRQTIYRIVDTQLLF